MHFNMIACSQIFIADCYCCITITLSVVVLLMLKQFDTCLITMLARPISWSWMARPPCDEITSHGTQKVSKAIAFEVPNTRIRER